MIAYCTNDDCGMAQDDDDPLVPCPKCGNEWIVVGIDPPKRVRVLHTAWHLGENDKRLLRGMRIKV
jgi:hypothetical protein